MSDTWAACGCLPGVRPGSVSECSHYIIGKTVWNECWSKSDVQVAYANLHI